MNTEQLISLGTIGGVLVTMLVWLLKESWASCKKAVSCKVDEKVCGITHKNIDAQLESIQEKLDIIQAYIMDK